MADKAAVHQTAPPQRADPQRAAARPAERTSMPARAGIDRLQRALGNSGMHRLLRSGAIQPKLAVGPADDQYEREADRVADHVMRMPDPEAGLIAQPTSLHVQRMCPECEEEELQRAPIEIQRKCPACEEAELQRAKCPECEKASDDEPDEKKDGIVQAKSKGGDPPEPSSELASYVTSSRGSGQPLPPSARERFETRFGHDFSAVRVHTDTRAADAATEINSYAFATGSDIHFGPGRFQPGTTQGDRLLAHELTHTIQQTGGRPLTARRAAVQTVSAAAAPSGTITRSRDDRLQRFPSASDIVDSLEDTVSDAADAAQGAVAAVGGAASDAVDSAGDGLAAAGDAVSDAAGAVADTAGAAASAVAEAGEEAIDWLATEAGQIASALADSLGASVTITANGLEIVVPRICPLDAITEGFDLGSIDGEYMVPIVAIPIGSVALTGEVGVAGHIEPHVEIQVGPVCLNGLRILVNPITGSFSISGSVSATAAASLAAELRGGLRGAVSLKGVVPIGGVPVPVDVPIAGLEGGIAGLVRAIGAGTLTIGGGLSAAGGTISMHETSQLDLGLAGDLFVGAYGQVDVIGKNICRIYWQPFEWHGDVAGSFGLTFGVTVTPGGSPSVVPTISPPTFTKIPFSQIPLALSREGFSDDCPIKDAICEVLEALRLLPSQNGGVWNDAGPYGPGPPLAGPLDVYQKNPGIPSGAECRGACGPDCVTCEPTPIHRYVDPVTGDIWEYINFQDCNTNEGCQAHDAAFDWAAAVHGETGSGAIIMPWHMAANIECTCENLAGNCIAWIAGLPPYDDKLFFADSATLVAPGGKHGTTGGSCHTDFPNAPDCVASFPDRDMVLEAWGAAHRIENFRDCVVVADFTLASAVDCGGGPGNLWNCAATDAVTGQAVTVGIFECICCNDDDTSSSTWTEPHIVVDPTVMSEELILELCDRGLIPRVICIPFEEAMIARFGNDTRRLDINPDTDPTSRRRPDDAPILDTFKRFYNRVDSWNIFLKTAHPDLFDEMNANPDLNIDAHRRQWLKEISEAGDDFKDEFRDITDTDPEKIRARYNTILARIETEVDALDRRIATFFKARTGDPRTIDEIIEDVHLQGTELWRAAWRRAILQVNRILTLLWPPARTRLLFFVGQKRSENPGVDLSGPVGDIDYLGSLASGFKGPQKQNIRFDPQNFDVDAFIEAPPLSKYAVKVKGLRPKNGNIFASATDVEPLNTFAGAAQSELLAKVDGYKKDDPFDVAIKTPDLPEQTREKSATERLFNLREKLAPDDYNRMLDELKRGGFLTPDGTKVRENLSEPEFQAVMAIMDRFDTPQAPPAQQGVRTASR